MQSLLRKPVEIPARQEEDALLRSAQQGDTAARNELIQRHMPAILNASRRHHQPYFFGDDDLAHECVLGMCHAIRKFDERKTTGRFLSYAWLWMRSYMQRGIERGSLMPIPRYKQVGGKAYETMQQVPD